MKKGLLIISTLIFIIVISGCSTNAYETYIDAARQTDSIEEGQSSYEVVIESEYNTEGLSQEDIKNLNYFKRIEAKTYVAFREKKADEKVIARNYMNFGGMGFDLNYYYDNGNTFIKMPIVGKYLVLDDIMAAKEDTSKNEAQFNEETFKTIKDKWIGILSKKDVISGEKILLDTEDGEVKATKFTISLTGEQVKTLLKSTLDIIESDDNLISAIDKGIIENNGENINSSELIDSLKDWLNQTNIKGFNYTGYIDIDGYIIEENIEISLEAIDKKPGNIISQKLTMEFKNWDIEKEQSFDFPKLTEDNTLDMENINEGVPFMFDDYLNGSQEEAE